MSNTTNFCFSVSARDAHSLCVSLEAGKINSTLSWTVAHLLKKLEEFVKVEEISDQCGKLGLLKSKVL
jgi:hypothetical protein